MTSKSGSRKTGKRAQGDVFDALTGHLFVKGKAKVKVEPRCDEKGLDRDPSVHSGEPGTSHQAFTPVCEVGRSPHSTGDIAAESSEGVHLGYIGDHNQRYEPEHHSEHAPRTDGTTFTTAQTSLPIPSPSHLRLFSNSELKLGQESGVFNNPGKATLDNRQRAINLLQCWDVQIPPWVLDESIPLDLDRVRLYTDLMEIPAPAWIARSVSAKPQETFCDQPRSAQTYQPRIATTREFKTYYNSAFEQMQNTAYPRAADEFINGGSTQNIWANADIRRDGIATGITGEPLRGNNTTLATNSHNQAITQTHEQLPVIPSKATAEPLQTDTFTETHERIDAAHSRGDVRLRRRFTTMDAKFSSFNTLDPIGSLKVLESEFEIYDIFDPKDQLCALKEQAGERLWRRYLTCKRDSSVSYPSFRNFLLQTLKQTYTCLETKHVSSLDEFEEVWAAIQDSPKEAKDRHFLLQLLNPTEQTTINSHPNDSLDESAERVRALIRSRTLLSTQQNTYHASHTSDRNARFYNSYGRNYNYPRQRFNRIPQHYQRNAKLSTRRVISPAKNNSAHICFYHQRFRHNAYSCEGPPCSKYTNQRIVQPLDIETDNVQREANLAVQESRNFVNQGNFQPRATQ